MPQKRLVLKGFYTTGETMQKLGVRKDMLYVFVRNEKLTRHIPPGRKQAYYAKSEVDDLARELQAFMAVSGRPIATFQLASQDDMTEAARLVNAIFGVYPNVERRIGWIKRNPEVCYLLKADGKAVGIAYVLPLSLEKIHQILEQETTPPILPEEVQPYMPGVPTHLWLMSLGVTPGLSKTDKRLWGSRLISNLIKVIINLGERGIELETIQARSDTPDGIRILKHMGFTEIHSTTNNRNFMIKVAESGIPAIEEYKAALAQWKQEHVSVIQ